MGEPAEKVRNWATHYAPGVIILDAGTPPANDTKLVEVPRYMWVHCANEGRYEGHHQGPFDLTRKVFESFVKNFRAHPQFKQGSLELDGGRGTHAGGIAPVLQYDYEHASECAPWEGSIPASGAPACAWALDCEIRNRPDNRAGFWVFTELLDPLRAQIAARQQRWVSIAFALESVHWITREPLGPMLTSIAITNHPFMLDLEPLAAANRRTSQPARAAVPSSGKPSEAPGDAREPTRTGAPMEDKLRERICRALKIQALADDATVGAAVEETTAAAGGVKGLLEALGVKDVDAAMKTIPELRSARDQLSAALSELDSLLGQDAAADAGMSKVDVGAAMKAGKLTGTGAEEALSAYRQSLIDGEIGKVRATKKPGETVKLSEVRAAREVGRKAFLTKYGVSNTDLQHLSSTLVAAPGGQQVTAPAPGTAPIVIEPRSDTGKPVVDLTGVPGPNPTLRFVAHLSATDKSFAALPYDKRVKRASELRKTVELKLQ